MNNTYNFGACFPQFKACLKHQFILIVNFTFISRWEIAELTPAICVQKVVDAVARLAEQEKIFLHKVKHFARSKDYCSRFQTSRAV